jgi:hypothetical protein
MATSQSTNAKIATFIADTEIAHQIVHGGDTTTVETDGGPVDSYAKTMRELRDGGALSAGELIADLTAQVNADADAALLAMTTRTDAVADQIEADYVALGVAVGLAQVGAESASGSSVIAESAALRAEDAADLAQASSNTVWRNTLALLEAVTTEPAETPGVVTDDPVPANNGYYKYSGTAWVLTAFQPAKNSDVVLLDARQTATEAIVEPLDEAVKVKTSIHDEDGRKYPFALVDGTRMLMGFLGKGGMRLKNLLVELGAGYVRDSIGRTKSRELDDGFQFAGFRLRVTGSGIFLMDKLGRTALAITRKGKIYAPGLDVPAPTDATFVMPPLGLQQLTDIIHILLYGQSLSRGTNTVTAISTVQPYNNITLQGGVRARPGDVTYNITGFKPLVEETPLDGSTQAETPISGICNGFVRRAVADGQDSANWVLCGTSSGNSARPVEHLSPGGPFNHFENMAQLITDAYTLAISQGKSYSVWAHVYMQGEANVELDQTDGRATDAYLYAQRELAMNEALCQHIVETTGQTFRPYMFQYQVAAHRSYGNDRMDIALAHWRTSREQPHVVLAVPAYAIPVGADAVHLTQEGSWLIGEYISRAISHTMYRRAGKWRPLEPVSYDWTATHIDIKFHVPCGPLVIDTALCAAATDSGFDIREAGASVPGLITAVAVTEPDTVRLTLSRATTTDAIVTYARGRIGDLAKSGPVLGARGNLRDSHGVVDQAVSPLGNTFYLHNPCVMFEINRQKGF